MKRFVAVAIAAFAVSVPAAHAAGAPGSLVPASEKFAGKTYAQWLTVGWQWQLAHGRLQTEAPKQALQCLPQANRGVFFLQDAYEGPTPVTVNCAIPAGRYLYLEGPGFECSTIEPPP